MRATGSHQNRLAQERGRCKKDAQPGETKLGPVTLDWKVNVTAVVAFLVSVSALLLQAMGYWKGAIVMVHPADKVLINTDNSTIRVGARMVYTNDGATSYNAVILRESVSFRLNDDEYQQWSEERGTFSVEKSGPLLKNAADASPFVVPAMQLVTHEAYFAAREHSSDTNPWKNRITREQFVQMLETEYSRGIRKIEFIFRSISREISGFKAGDEKLLTTTCFITLDDGLIRRMKNEGWASRSCQRAE